MEWWGTGAEGQNLTEVRTRRFSPHRQCRGDGLKGGATLVTDPIVIQRDQGFEGLTHERASLSRPDFEMVPAEPEWVRARVPWGDDAASRDEQDMV